ncbi:MAG: adenylate/guanylate cyclase domain-containing protein [Verrucomicrobiales bacterium]|nr:adenylate/guanylate cyclase domain-containing protein [Verrucomicrobiales bacterium]
MNRNRYQICRTVVILSLLGTLFGAFHLIEPASEWEEASVDLRLRHRKKVSFSKEVGLVVVDDDDVANPQFGAWPFPRSVHADVIRILRAMEAKQIIFDILFVDPTEEAHDTALAAAILERKDITLPYHFEDLQWVEGTPEGDPVSHFFPGHRLGVDVRSSPALKGVRPIPLYQSFPGSYGAVNVKPDAGNSVIRRVPMLIQHNGKLYPGLALQTVIETLDLDPDQIRVLPGKEIQLVDTPQGNLRIPIDNQMQYRINFTSGADEFRPVFQYLDLYRAVEDPEQAAVVNRALSNRPVIIGNVSTGTSDVVTTPIGRLPGVLVQATAIANILGSHHLHFFPSWVQVLWCGLAGAFLGLILRTGSAWSAITVAVVFVALYGFAATCAARFNWMIPLLPVVELSLISLVGMLWLQIRTSHDERDRTLEALGKYVSPAVARRALREEAFASEQPDRREITIFFSDIRGFTEWSERKEPEEVTSVLNDYLKAMTEIVVSRGGTLDKFVGDCIMVVFNAPDNLEDHAERAVRMAWEMQEKITELSEAWQSLGREPIQVGMGIHTGFVTVGNFGSDLFSDYTAIGNNVNLAARIEESSGPGQILVSETTYLRTAKIMESRPLGEKQFKGVKEPVPVFEVICLIQPDVPVGND